MKTELCLGLILFGYRGAAQELQPAPGASSKLFPTSWSTEYDRSIRVLETGVERQWKPFQYQTAFDGNRTPDRAGDPFVSHQPLSACRSMVQEALHPRINWSHRPSFAVEIKQVLDSCRAQRDRLLAAEIAGQKQTQ